MKKNHPEAICILKGSREYPELTGVALFNERAEGVSIRIQVKGFPVPRRIRCNQPICALHIHEGSQCRGTRNQPFENAKGHFNPNHCPHPYHAGDLGNLFINRNGTAFMSLISDRFTVNEVMNRVMIIHRDLDDFTTQPSGNSGEMIACGVIKPYRKESA